MQKLGATEKYIRFRCRECGAKTMKKIKKYDLSLPNHGLQIN